MVLESQAATGLCTVPVLTSSAASICTGVWLNHTQSWQVLAELYSVHCPHIDIHVECSDRPHLCNRILMRTIRRQGWLFMTGWSCPPQQLRGLRHQRHGTCRSRPYITILTERHESKSKWDGHRHTATSYTYNVGPVVYAYVMPEYQPYISRTKENENTKPIVILHTLGKTHTINYTCNDSNYYSQKRANCG